MCNPVMIRSLDEQDTDRILRMLYNGTRPAKVHTLVCACGCIADLRTSPKAWNGWQILPFAKCPECIQKALATNVELADQPWNHALELFKSKLEELRKVGIT